MRKDLSYLKKSRWLLLTIFSQLLGSNSMWAQTTVKEGFEEWSTSVAEGWLLINSATYGNSYSYDYVVGSADFTPNSGSNCLANSSHSAAQGTTTSPMIVTPQMTGTLTFKFRKYNSSSSTKGYINIFEYDETTGTATGNSIWTCRPNYTNEATSKYQDASITIGDTPKRYAIYLAKVSIDDLSYTSYAKPADGPALAVKDGTAKVTSPYSYNFGLATAGTTKTFTLSNPGTKDLSVSVSEEGNFNAILSATTIAAGSDVTLTVTMPDATGSSAITITPAIESGIAPFVINVSGTIRDANKLYENGFTALPTDWTTTGTWNYNATYGAYTTAWYLSSNARLITPKLTVSEGETFFVEAKGYSTSNTSYQHLQMQYSADGTTWTNFDSEPTLDPSTWNTFAFTGVPAGNYYIAINASQADIRMFYGGELPNEPKMVVNQPASLAFTAVQKDEANPSLTFTIANTGKATLEGINVSSSNPAFTVSGAPTSLDAGTSQEVTITMSSASVGNMSSDITVGATDMPDVQFTVTGVVLPPGLSIIDFNDDKLPEGWTNEGSSSYYIWSFSNNEAYKPYTSASNDAVYYMQTPKVSVNNGDMIALRVKKFDSSMARLTLKGLADDNTEVYSKDITLQTDYQWVLLDNIPTTVKHFRFHGSYAYIDEIRGINYDQNSPVMSFTAEDFAAGVVTANASKTYTVANSGTGTLTVDITSDNTNFTVEPAQLVITDTPQDFTVTFNYADGSFGKFNANITVTPTYDATAAVTFAASATVKNPDLWDEDFEEGSLPTGWVANNWTIGTFSSYENTSNMALAPSSSTAGTLITPCLSAKANDVLTWDAYFKWADEPLIVEYSNDLNAWTPLTTIYGTENGEKGSGQVNYHKAMSFTAPADGNYYLRFTSTYQNGVDNFNGFKLNLPDHIMAITASNIPASGSYSPSMKATKSFNATVTVKESRGVKEENVVAKLYMGTEVIGTSETVTVEANETKQINITATPTVAATEGVEMHIEVEFAGGTLTTTPETRYVAELVKLELTETDSKEIQTGYSAVYDEVTLTRSFANGWNTFIAPAEVSLSDIHENAIAYSFNSFNNNELGFTRVNSTTLSEATPYIIYVPEDVTRTFTWDSPVIYSTYVGEENTKLTRGEAIFQGTYAPMTAGQLEGKYGVVPSTGKIQKGGATATMKGFRAYFELPAGTSSGARLSFTDVTTGITTVMDASELGDDAFNLKGQRVDTPKKGGLYIIGGKKVIVK